MLKKIVRKINLGKLLLIAYLCLVLVLGVTGIIAYKNSKLIIATYNEVYENSYKKSQLLNDIHKNASHIQTMVRDLVRDKEHMNDELKLIAHGDIQSKEDWAQYLKLVGPNEVAEKSKVDSMLQYMDGDRKCRNDLLQLITTGTGEADDAAFFYNNVQKRNFEEYHMAIEAFTDFIFETTAKANQRAEEYFTSYGKKIILLTALIILSLAVLGFMVRRMICKLKKEITQRKHAIKLVEENEEKYRSLIEKSIDGIYKSSHDGKFIDVNPALVNMLGYDSKEELLSIDIKTQLYFDSADREDAFEQDKYEGISVFRLKRKDGSEIWVEDHGQYIYGEDDTIHYHEGILRDVTKRIRTELKLQSSMKELSDYKYAIDQGAIVELVDSHGKIKYVNENFCKISKYDAEELIGQDHRIMNSGYHPSSFYKELWDTINSGKIWRAEMRNRAKDGTYFWVDSTIVPFLDAHGKPYQFLIFRKDITSRMGTEEKLRTKNTELEKSNHELDKFVYSVSHDLRAPLSSMIGLIEISKEETEEPLLLEHLTMLDGNIRKLDRFIQDILDYSRNSRTEVVREEINFKELLTDISDHLKYMGADSRPVDLKINIHDGVYFKSDKSRLSIVLNNLISNAIRYQNPKVNQPFVDVEVDTSDTELHIVVRDNGIGVSKELHDKIFDMFYRVSDNSIGSGLGLYIVKETIEKLHGQINIKSEIGEGTAFDIHIPNN